VYTITLRARDTSTGIRGLRLILKRCCASTSCAVYRCARALRPDDRSPSSGAYLSLSLARRALIASPQFLQNALRTLRLKPTASRKIFLRL
jgi:hypothetical protein